MRVMKAIDNSFYKGRHTRLMKAGQLVLQGTSYRTRESWSAKEEALSPDPIKTKKFPLIIPRKLLDLLTG